jgi:hypothetical protein
VFAFLEHLPWYVHVSMSLALLMAALFLGLMMRGLLTRPSTPRAEDAVEAQLHRAQSVERILERIDEVERRLLARDDKLLDVVRELESVAMDLRNLLK